MKKWSCIEPGKYLLTEGKTLLGTVERDAFSGPYAWSAIIFYTSKRCPSRGRNHPTKKKAMQDVEKMLKEPQTIRLKRRFSK